MPDSDDNSIEQEVDGAGSGDPETVEEPTIEFEVAEGAVGAAEDSASVDDPESALKQQLREANDRVLRSQAEIENVRRRMRRERDEERLYAFQPLLTELLPVIDNIDRALEAAEGVDDSSGLLQGFKMVAQQLQDSLKKHNCNVIEADGVPFDPTKHEALAQQPSADVEPGTVLTVHQKGYMLRDRCIRPAQVIVSKEVD